MAYQVRIDADLCISSGTCVAEAPDTFTLNENNLAEPRPGAACLPAERLLRIARHCPAGAIVLLDETGAEVDVFAAR